MKAAIIFIFTLFLFSCYGQENVKKAYQLFASANSRLKTTFEDIDSIMIATSIAEYTEAIRLYPKFAYAYRNRSRWYERTGRYKEAINDLTLAIKYADTGDGYYLRGMRALSYYQLGLYDSAIMDLDFAIIRNDGSMPYYLLTKAKALYKQGKKEAACTCYQKAIAISPRLADEKEFLECE